MDNDFYGIAAGSSMPSLPPEELDRQLSGMAELGVSWVRFDIEWSQVGGAGAGLYDWSATDRVVAAAAAKGLRPLAILDYTPAWARTPDCTDGASCAPRDPAEFAAFAAAAATRYAGLGVRAWEIWNEPNLRQFYAPRPDPAGYTRLLQASSAAIRGVDPQAVVLTGGTAPAATAADGSTITATDFLRGIYAAGGAGSFDAVAHHPYTFPYSPVTAYSGGAWSDQATLHRIMAQHGDGAKKIWATEYGAPTGGPGTQITKDARREHPASSYVSEPLQAVIAVKAIRRYRKLDWAGPLFWYSYQDSGTDPASIENFFGLVRRDGSHKPAYAAFQSVIKQ
jgi:hypothetical protein